MRAYREETHGYVRTCTRFHNTPYIVGQEVERNKSNGGHAPTPDRDRNYYLIDIGAIAWPVIDDNGKDGEGASRCNLGHRVRVTL
jgi:hypothetical protein